MKKLDSKFLKAIALSTAVSASGCSHMQDNNVKNEVENIIVNINGEDKQLNLNKTTRNCSTHQNIYQENEINGKKEDSYKTENWRNPFVKVCDVSYTLNLDEEKILLNTNKEKNYNFINNDIFKKLNGYLETTELKVRSGLKSEPKIRYNSNVEINTKFVDINFENDRDFIKNMVQNAGKESKKAIEVSNEIKENWMQELEDYVQNNIITEISLNAKTTGKYGLILDEEIGEISRLGHSKSLNYSNGIFLETIKEAKNDEIVRELIENMIITKIDGKTTLTLETSKIESDKLYNAISLILAILLAFGAIYCGGKITEKTINYLKKNINSKDKKED